MFPVFPAALALSNFPSSPSTFANVHVTSPSKFVVWLVTGGPGAVFEGPRCMCCRDLRKFVHVLQHVPWLPGPEKSPSHEASKSKPWANEELSELHHWSCMAIPPWRARPGGLHGFARPFDHQVHDRHARGFPHDCWDPLLSTACQLLFAFQNHWQLQWNSWSLLDVPYVCRSHTHELDHKHCLLHRDVGCIFQTINWSDLQEKMLDSPARQCSEWNMRQTGCVHIMSMVFQNWFKTWVFQCSHLGFRKLWQLWKQIEIRSQQTNPRNHHHRGHVNMAPTELLAGSRRQWKVESEDFDHMFPTLHWKVKGSSGHSKTGKPSNLQRIWHCQTLIWYHGLQPSLHRWDQPNKQLCHNQETPQSPVTRPRVSGPPAF